jgi:TrmH family RNA methyltransferase
MISKQLAKFVKSLKLKKYRNKASVFVVEGAKNVSEVLHSKFEIQHLFITEKYLKEFGASIPSSQPFTLCSDKELINLGTFQSNEYALAVVKMNERAISLENDKIILALDDIRDPGNLGTIIRIADWYGINNIIASEETADFYNPKVISASMGSFTRVNVIYMNMALFFQKNPSFRVYGAFLNGNSIHTLTPKFPAAILLGSESNGIRPDLYAFCHEKITIPRLGGAESLNVAVSAAVICDNLLRH